MDLALVPNNQLNLWTKLKVADTQKNQQDTHPSIMAESMMRIYHQTAQAETKNIYNINHNQSGAHRLQAYTGRITNAVQNKITYIQAK